MSLPKWREHIGMCGNVGVGELGPTPDARHDDAARHHRVQVPDSGDTLHWGGGGSSKGLPRPPALAPPLPTPGERRMLHMLLQQPGVEQKLKILLPSAVHLEERLTVGELVG